MLVTVVGVGVGRVLLTRSSLREVEDAGIFDGSGAPPGTYCRRENLRTKLDANTNFREKRRVCDR